MCKLHPNSMVITSKKHILLIGAGGLCHAALPSILNLPFEKITLMDGDVVTEEPLPRQWIFTKNDLGQSKVNVLQKWIMDRYPNKKVIALDQYFNEEIAFQPDLIFDFTDRLISKLSVLKFCQKNRIPLIHAASQKNHGAIAFLDVESELYHYLIADISGNTNPEMTCYDGVTASVVGTIGVQAAHFAWLYFEGLAMPHSYNIYDGKSNRWENFNFQQNAKDELVLDYLIASTDQFIAIKEKYQAEILHLGEHKLFPSCEPDELRDQLLEISNVIILCKNGIEACTAAAYFSKKFTDKHIFAFAGPADSLIPSIA